MNEALLRYQTAGASRETVVTVAASGGDYTTIKAAVAGVTPTAAAPVRIYVRNGTYNEIQIDAKDYLTIEGESQAGVIMVSDGTRTDVDPVSGERYVDMANADKHGFWVQNIFSIENMTIRVNDVKYCMHMDNAAGLYRTFTNVRFEHANGFPIGIGGWSGQQMDFTGCTFVKTGVAVYNTEGSHGVYWHTWNGMTLATMLNLTDCTSVNCGLAYLYEFGSDQTDLCTFTDCVSGEARGIYFNVTDFYWNGGGQGVTNVPYCINILTIDGALALDYSTSDRPNLLDHVSQE